MSIVVGKGALRPAVEAAFASQVMYYEERVKEGECHDVSLRMQSVLVRLILASGRLRRTIPCARGESAARTV